MLKLSYIIPVFNGESVISKSLDSIFSQDLPEEEYEVIVVDGHSQDKTIKLLNTYKEKHSNLIVIEQPFDTKQGGGRNEGIKVAKGEYIAFCDADDQVEDGIVHAISTAIHLEVDILCAATLRCGKYSEDDFIHTLSAPEGIVFDGKYFLEQYMIPIYWHAVWGLLFRRSFLLGINRPFVEGRYDEDCDWMAWHLFHSKKIANINSVIYRYCYNPSSTLHKELKINKIADGICCAARRMQLAATFKTECPKFSEDVWNAGWRINYIDKYLTPVFLSSISPLQTKFLFENIGDNEWDYLQSNYSGEFFPIISFKHPKLALGFVLLTRPVIKLFNICKKFLGRQKRKFFHV